MDWLSGLDWSHWQHWLAQTPTPAPAPTPTTEVELLRNQLEFLRAENARLSADFAEKLRLITDESKTLSESFTRFVSVMQFVLVVFGFLGGVVFFVFKQNLDDAREVAARMIGQEVERRVAAIADARIDLVRRSLLREEVITTTLVDYCLPGTDRLPPEISLLRARGVQQVQFNRNDQELRRSPADVVVLDLVHWQDAAGTPFAALPKDDRERQALDMANHLLNLLPQTSALVIYVGTQVSSLYSLPKDRYVVPANAAITLVGMVADAAYVARGAQGGA